jgi:hypothetical protein
MRAPLRAAGPVLPLPARGFRENRRRGCPRCRRPIVPYATDLTTPASPEPGEIA